VVRDPDLIEEVIQLTEDPWGQIGHIEPSSLELPREVLLTSMRNHQRYFAVEDEHGRLMPYFIVFNNTRVRQPGVVARGNERVLRARLHDARFFYAEDRKKALASRVDQLTRVTFLGELSKLGVGEDLLSRTGRLEKLAALVARVAFAGRDAVLADATRAARLSKADLLTLMVGEFPELQGTIGSYYARGDGERAEVAAAVGEQYKPRGASDTPAQTPAGVCLALADKLELMACCFALGLIPSGNKDPYGLRRAAIGVLKTVQVHNLDLDLRPLATAAVTAVNATVAHQAADQILQFIGARLRSELLEDTRTDLVDAVLAAGFDRPQDARARVKALHDIAQ
jgi:glycyl-tRNA synthetase beta chain